MKKLDAYILPIEQAMITMVNRERKLRGLKELKTSAHLSCIARKHSQVQLRHKDIFHESPEDFSTHGGRIKRDGYLAMSSAENVATAPELEMSHVGLMNSPGHYKNIVGDWEEIGIGITIDRDGQLYVTQLFANPVIVKDPRAIKTKWIAGIQKMREKHKLSSIQFYNPRTFENIDHELEGNELSALLTRAGKELACQGVSFSESRIFYFLGFNNSSSDEQMRLLKNPKTTGVGLHLSQMEDGRILGLVLILI